jgi:hypothetical protein
MRRGRDYKGRNGVEKRKQEGSPGWVFAAGGHALKFLKVSCASSMFTVGEAASKINGIGKVWTRAVLRCISTVLSEALLYSIGERRDFPCAEAAKI